MNHPVFQNKLRIAAWWLTWVLMALGQFFLYYYAYGSSYRIIIPDILISFATYSGIGLVLWYPFRYFNSKTFRLNVLVSNIIILGAVTIALWVILSKYLLAVIIGEPSEFNNYWESTLPYRLGSGASIYGLIILTYYLIMSLSDLAEKKAREARLESVIRETELKMLRSQINPHFLFNTLNSISALTISDPQKAQMMVIKLSEFMRYALSQKDERPVTLGSELDNIRLYLEIEKVRFGERLDYKENISGECLSALIPVLLLQPLYENAIKYGVHESTGKVVVETQIRCNGSMVEISIGNNFDDGARTIKGTGTGLANVEKRLELYYGGKASMHTGIEGNVFKVVLILPAGN